MAIPFFEPKTTTTPLSNNHHNANNNNNQMNYVAPTNPQYDQVDGHSVFMQPVGTTTATTSTPTATSITSVASSSSTFTQNPSTSTQNPSTTTSPSSSSQPTSTIEQQALAWKILALTMCKALKEYHLKTASSKDAFTNQTVQVLPNGEVQPLWK